MDQSIFMEAGMVPDSEHLREALDASFGIWEKIRRFAVEAYPGAVEEWNFPGTRYGWSFRVKDRKRAIVYLLPRSGYFKVAFVFGDRAVGQILLSPVKDEIKGELQTARKYAEGRGIRIDVRNESDLQDIYTLITIKINA